MAARNVNLAAPSRVLEVFVNYRDAQSSRWPDRPLVCLAYAQGLCGSVALRPDAPCRLSSAESLRFTHGLRAAHDAVMVGSRTVRADDPLLTVRYASGPNPRPVVLDTRLQLADGARLFNGEAAPIIVGSNEADRGDIKRLERGGATVVLVPGSAGRLSLPHALDCLARLGIRTLMVEGGARVISSFLDEGLAELAVITICPIYLNGVRVPSRDQKSSSRLAGVSHWPLRDDLIVIGRPTGTRYPCAPGC